RSVRDARYFFGISGSSFSHDGSLRDMEQHKGQSYPTCTLGSGSSILTWRILDPRMVL
ncbi:hypothetical protein PoB_002782600, partial [Plakobranchus ocellatus]